MLRLVLLALVPVITFAQEETCLVQQDQPFGNPSIGTSFSAMPILLDKEVPETKLKISLIEACQNSAGRLVGLRFGVDQVNTTNQTSISTFQEQPVGLVPSGVSNVAYCQTMVIPPTDYIRKVIMKTGTEGVAAIVFMTSADKTLIGGNPGNFQDTEQLDFVADSPLVGFYGTQNNNTNITRIGYIEMRQNCQKWTSDQKDQILSARRAATAGVVIGIVILLLVAAGIGAVFWIKKNRPELLRGRHQPKAREMRVTPSPSPVPDTDNETKIEMSHTDADVSRGKHEKSSSQLADLEAVGKM